MYLARALETARSSLQIASNRAAVISQNVGGAGDAGYSRRVFESTTSSNGARVVSVERRVDVALFTSGLRASGDSSMRAAIAKGLDSLTQIIGSTDSDHSPAARLRQLSESLQSYSLAPSNLALASDAVGRASELATTLRLATEHVSLSREAADREIGDIVQRLREDLSRLETLNGRVVQGTLQGADVSGDLDARDSLIRNIAEVISVNIVRGPGNDVSIYLENGVTLFETTARPVSFLASGAFSATTVGNAIVVDSVPVMGSASTLSVTSGKLAGLIEIRDSLAPTMQSQLDEIARGLVEAFAETDQSPGGVKPASPGLFTYPGAAGVPVSGVQVLGLAGKIEVNVNVDPTRGGVVSRLRDGGISNPADPDYVYNTGGHAGFAGRITGLLGSIESTRSFDPMAGAGTEATISAFAAGSVGWLSYQLTEARSAADYSSSVLMRNDQALLNAVGVNIDEEMSLMFEVDRSYQTTAKLITMIDGMLDELMRSIG